jgi:hypothetical protein
MKHKKNKIIISKKERARERKGERVGRGRLRYGIEDA